MQRGYTGTTVSAIASEAGVALQSVYKTGGNKADLLHHVLDVAVGGDDRDVALAERPVFQEILDEPDAEQTLRLFAAMICDIQERLGPLQRAAVESAAIDPKAAEYWRNAHRLRSQSHAEVIASIAPERLRCTPAEAVATTWSIGSAEVYDLMRTLQGFSAADLRSWLADTLVAALVAPG